MKEVVGSTTRSNKERTDSFDDSRTSHREGQQREKDRSLVWRSVGLWRNVESIARNGIAKTTQQRAFVMLWDSAACVRGA